MIVNRRTFNVKKGRIREAVELLKTPLDFLDSKPLTMRIYISNIGTFDQVAFEQEFENLTEYEKSVSAFAAAPGTPALMEKWLDVTLEGGTNEIWILDD